MAISLPLQDILISPIGMLREHKSALRNGSANFITYCGPSGNFIRSPDSGAAAERFRGFRTALRDHDLKLRQELAFPNPDLNIVRRQDWPPVRI